jgi:cell division protease FtsH
MVKEIGIGITAGILVFLVVQGIDVTPIIMLAAIAGGIFYLLESKVSIGVMKGKSKGQNTKLITFKDIGGQAAAIKELKEALDFINKHDEIKHLGIRPLKGILLTGPPGTGKTLLAKAAATYTEAAFLSTSGSEFIEMYAGVGAQRVRKLFKQAREMAKKEGKSNAIIFIDEIDVLGGKRGQTTSHLEYDQTLNQLLVELDGIKNNEDIRILLVAATNRADLLDDALLRPGRFDRQVKVDLPDKEGRTAILKLHARNKPLAEDVNLDQIAKETFGFSGAHLESLTNEAAIFAMRENVTQIYQHHLKEAVDKVIMGEKLDKRPNVEELKRVGIHEIGHALIGEINRPNSVATVTVTPRGGALGYMRQTPEDDSYLFTKEYLEGQIAVCLAGAIAEELILGNRSTGSANDFEQAIKMARRIIISGMSPLGVVSEEILPKELRHRVISKIIKEQEDKVTETITQYKEKFNLAVEKLLDQEKITGEEFREIFFNNK